ncbi:MAG: chemotaxis protein CheW, partial [Deltaproteobacteria bacterium]|nr:chemotaxis protein CheW [Deltaproteobacteria bacterium]
LTDPEIYNLIFAPGFSTAKKITDVSGRGVGMDVVRKAIEKLRGRVEINSRLGHGSTFVISLPLTLAIIEGMLVRVGKERYIIPALAILESFRPKEDRYSTLEGKGEMILSRGNLIPLIRLDRLFGVQGDCSQPWDGLVVAVEYDNEQRCLLLDELLGKEEVVIKSLGESLKNVRGIAGGAIMGDGRVGLILDMAGIFKIAENY